MSIGMYREMLKDTLSQEQLNKLLGYINADLETISTNIILLNEMRNDIENRIDKNNS